MPQTKYLIPMVVIVYWAVIAMSLSRFYLGVNPSSVSCLKVYVLLVDKLDQDVTRGDIAAFEFKQDLRHLHVGDRIGKLVAAISGDKVEFDENNLYVNGKQFKRVMSMTPMLKHFNQNITAYQTTYTLGPDEYFMVGETFESFDSRYWGPIKKSQLVGQAYAVY